MDPQTLVQNAIENKSRRGLTARHPLCFAPKAGLYFNADGSIGACCYNRADIFGHYPKSTIREAWDSTVRAAMCSSLQANEFPSGCSRCASEIYKSSQVRPLAARYDHWRNSEQEPTMPTSVEFELGTVCNLECEMCNGWVSSAIRKNREKLLPLKSPYDDAFIDQLKEFVPFFTDVKFLGGEPFLNRLNYRVWDLLIQCGSKASVGITTNGSILGKRVQDILLTLRPWLTISTESLQRENYEQIRKNASYDVLRKHMDWLIERRLLNGLTACVMPSNWRDLPEMVSFCNRNDLTIYFNTVFDPASSAMHSLSCEELLEALHHLVASPIEETGKYRDHNAGIYASLIQQIRGLIQAKGRVKAAQQSAEPVARRPSAAPGP